MYVYVFRCDDDVHDECGCMFVLYGLIPYVMKSTRDLRIDIFVEKRKKERKKHCEKNARKLLCYKCNSIWKRKPNRNKAEKRARETRKITWFKEKYYFEYKIKSYINCFLWFHWKRLTKFGWWQSCRVHRPFDRCDCTILIAVKRFDFDLYCLHRMHLTEALLRKKKKRRTK